MSWIDAIRNTAASAGAATQRQAQRVRLEAARVRLQRSIRGRKTVIGEAIYPQLAAGEVSTDLPEVSVAMNAIEEFNEELAANRAELEELMADGDEDSDEGR